MTLCLIAFLLAPSSVSARRLVQASLIMEASSGKVLYSRNAHTKTPPASLTKMMTIYLMFEALSKKKYTLNSKLRVSRKAAGFPSILNLRLKAGGTISVKNAILGMIVRSANDAAIVIAEALGGTQNQFARIMTRKARALGMSNTTFKNASGWPQRGQITTAKDIAILSRALYHNFPQYSKLFATKTFTFRGRRYQNSNKLLGKVRGVDGLKTGFVNASGFNLAASAVRNGRRLIGVVLGGRTKWRRNKKMTEIINTGFSRYQKSPPMPTLKPKTAPNLFLRQARLDVKTPKLKPSTNRTTILLTSRKGGRAPLPSAPPSLKLIKAVHNVIPYPKPLPNSKRGTEPLKLKAVNDSWGIQVGAFRAENIARLAIKSAANKISLLSHGQVNIVPQKEANGTIYRARLSGLTKNEAKFACEILSNANVPCTTIQGGG